MSIELSAPTVGAITRLAPLLPPGVMSAELSGPGRPAALLPEEATIAQGMSELRLREFAAGRACVREALVMLGRGETALLRGPDGSPRWPDDVRGSITHCTGYAAAAVAASARFAAVGIDAEPDEPLPDGVLDLVATRGDRLSLPERLTGRPCADRLLFSAKEAVYKVWSPLVGDWLDFADVEVQFDAGGAFHAVLHRNGLTVAGRSVRALRGRWGQIMVGGRRLLVTAIALRQDGSDTTAY